MILETMMIEAETRVLDNTHEGGWVDVEAIREVNMRDTVTGMDYRHH